MKISNVKEWGFGTIGLLTGCLGAFIESYILSGDLDHRYPFKIMSVPPAEYYAAVAETLASVAPFLAAGIGIFFFLVLKRHKIIAGLLPVILCPLTYIAGLRRLVSGSIYREQLQLPFNYDGSSAAMQHRVFYAGALKIMIFSVFVYLTVSAVVYAVNYRVSKKLL